jgi:hypothetical protein
MPAAGIRRPARHRVAVSRRLGHAMPPVIGTRGSFSAVLHCQRGDGDRLTSRPHEEGAVLCQD